MAVDQDLDSVLASRKVNVGRETAIKTLGAISILIGLLFVEHSFRQIVGEDRNQAGYYIVFVCFRLVMGLVLIAVGIGLDLLKTWARICAIILTVPGLAGFPGGTIFAVFVLYLLLGERAGVVFSGEYRGVIAKTPSANPGLLAWLKPFVLIVGIGIIALLFAGEFP